MIISKILFLVASIIVGLLGALHIVLTFCTNKFEPYDRNLLPLMQDASPLLSKDLSIWKSWIGFNASHSVGMMFIAAMNVYIATKHFPIVAKGDLIFLLNVSTVSVYVFLAARYWFSPPLIGTCISLLLFLVSYLMAKLS